MIDLYNGELLDMLPCQMSKEIEHICLSHALKKGIQLIIDRADMTRTQAFIDGLPERILDVLSVELHTPYYSEDLSIDQKREIIKRTLLWHLTAGTPSAMRELIGIVIGEGDIVEWPDFTDPPYTPGTFDILTDVRITEKIVETFIAIIERVKNERSHLRRLHIHRRMDARWYVGVCAMSHPHVVIQRDARGAEGRQYVGAALISWPTAVVRMGPHEVRTDLYIGAAHIPYTKNVIEEG